MHDAAAATEVVYYASRKLVANAMHCKQQTTGPKGMRSLHRYLCVLLLSEGGGHAEIKLAATRHGGISLVFMPGGRHEKLD